MSWFLFDVKYYEPGRTVRTPKANVDLALNDYTFSTGGVPYVIPPELIKVIGVDKIGPNTVIRSYLGSREEKAVHPITTKIIPHTGDPRSFYYHCRGINQAVGDHLVCDKLSEVGLRHLARECSLWDCKDVGDLIQEKLYKHSQDPDHDTVEGNVDDLAQYFTNEVYPYCDITEMLPHSYRYDELASLVSPILDLWVPDPYEPHRYDVRTLVSFMEPTIALKDHRYLGSDGIRKYYPYLKVKDNKDRAPIYAPSQELTDFGLRLQSDVLDEIYLKYISSKGEVVWRLLHARNVFSQEMDLDKNYLNEMLGEISTTFNPVSMLENLLPCDVKINTIEFCKTVDDVLYIRVNKSFDFVLDLTILSLGTQNLLWSEN